MKAWQIEATPRGVQCVRCFKPSEYRQGEHTLCGPCAIGLDGVVTTRLHADPRMAPTPRTLIVYAESKAGAATRATLAGYDVHSVGRYIPIYSPVFEGRRAPGA